MARFYIVDDEVWTLQSLEKMLYPFSIVDEIRIFQDSREALSAITTDPPDVLFTDLRMDYICGQNLISKVREMGLDIAIVIISAYSSFDAAREALSFGVIDYLLKPIKTIELEKVLNRLEKSLKSPERLPASSESLLCKVEAAYPYCRVISYKASNSKDRSALAACTQPQCMMLFDAENDNGISHAYLSTNTRLLPESFSAIPLTIGISHVHLGFSEISQMRYEAEISMQLGIRFSENASIGEIQAYLIHNYKRNISLDELASRFYANKTYLCNMFKKECGMTLVEFLRDVRMCEAKRLLLTTDNTIQAIATSIGYPDSAYFMKLFKRVTGLSPNAYRQRTSKE